MKCNSTLKVLCLGVVSTGYFLSHVLSPGSLVEIEGVDVGNTYNTNTVNNYNNFSASSDACELVNSSSTDQQIDCYDKYPKDCY